MNLNHGVQHDVSGQHEKKAIICSNYIQGQAKKMAALKTIKSAFA